MAAGGTSILEVQRRMTCGAYVQVGAGAWGAEGSVDSPGMLLLRSYGCLFLVLIWLVRNSLGGGGLPPWETRMRSAAAQNGIFFTHPPHRWGLSRVARIAEPLKLATLDTDNLGR